MHVKEGELDFSLYDTPPLLRLFNDDVALGLGSLGSEGCLSASPSKGWTIFKALKQGRLVVSTLAGVIGL
jgi:hypothetical protein